MHNQPTLTVVGAGPGDEELITLKGVRVLSTADVILYDALVNPNLLNHAPENALKVFVGKRAGQHLFQQRQINQMIVRYAYAHGHVVRLKGGDPFVFGRGQEELVYARKHGLRTQVIPGISSALAVPATQGIPLTYRGASQSFWVTTATDRNDTLAADVSLAAQSSATIVVLMGMKKLDQVVRTFAQHRGENEPIAIIQEGTLPTEKIGVGSLQTIHSVVAEHQLTAPAIIVIGSVVRERPAPQLSRQIAKQLL